MNGVSGEPPAALPLTKLEATAAGSWYQSQARQSEIARLLLLQLLDRGQGATYGEVRDGFLRLLDAVDEARKDDRGDAGSFTLVFDLHPTLPGMLDGLVGSFLVQKKEDGDEPRYVLPSGTRDHVAQRMAALQSEIPRRVIEAVS